MPGRKATTAQPSARNDHRITVLEFNFNFNDWSAHSCVFQYSCSKILMNFSIFNIKTS